MRFAHGQPPLTIISTCLRAATSGKKTTRKQKKTKPKTRITCKPDKPLEGRFGRYSGPVGSPTTEMVYTCIWSFEDVTFGLRVATSVHSLLGPLHEYNTRRCLPPKVAIMLRRPQTRVVSHLSAAHPRNVRNHTLTETTRKDPDLSLLFLSPTLADSTSLGNVRHDLIPSSRGDCFAIPALLLPTTPVPSLCSTFVLLPVFLTSILFLRMLMSIFIMVLIVHDSGVMIQILKVSNEIRVFDLFWFLFSDRLLSFWFYFL